MEAIGVVLAGGRGRRIGGDKALVELDGTALLLYPLRALAAVCEQTAVVAKRDTRLPPLPAGVERWVEPDVPRHPLTGIRHALHRAGGRPVLCCAVDLPRLDPPTLTRLLAADDGRHGCVVARAGGRLQPLCAVWHPRAAPLLAGLGEDVPLRTAVAAALPLEVDFADPRPFVNVNDAGDLRTLGR